MKSSMDARKVRYLAYGLSICFFLIHIGMFLLFNAYGVKPMAYFNVFSIVFYIGTLLMIKKGMLWLYSVSVLLEVAVHMFMAVCFVGVGAGFQVTLIGMNALAFCAEFTSVKLNKRRVSGIILGSVCTAFYIASFIISRLAPPEYELPMEFNFWLQLSWGVIVFAANILFLKLFVTSALRSDRNFHVVQTLAEAIDAKDPYTRGHSIRVATYSREIARRAGMSDKAQEDVFMMGLLHDVGKIGVPDAVINKPGRLTDEEFDVIKKHTVTGARILDKIEEMPELAVGARRHHERIDGAGYPSGLKGDEIPVEARILAVADAYDAMTSKRSYRDAMPQSKVREEIENGLGAQFDEKFGRIMLEMIDEDKDFLLRESA